MENKESMPQTREKKSEGLYPERMFLSVDRDIARLKQIESGEIKKLELTEAEKEKILEFEDALGEQLEQIFDIKLNSITIYPEYFLTDAGREDFLKTAGFDMGGDDVEQATLFLYKNRKKLDLLKGKDLSDLAGRSRAFNDDKLLEQLCGKMDAEGGVDFSGAQNPKRMSILLNPADALNKIRKLREFKRELVRKDDFGESDFEKAKKKILDIYRRRINEIIAGQFNSSVLVKNAADLLGEEELTVEEKGLMKMNRGLRDFNKAYSRYDRFLFGANKEYSEAGQREQIGKQIQQYADQIEKRYINNEINKGVELIERGLDPGKIFENNIPCEKFAEWEEQFLEQYGEKSSLPASEYDPKRNGPAPDGKWQFVASERYRSMEVNPKQKVIKSGILPKSIREALGTLLAHENTHFIQMINQPLLGLRLFKKIGGDRRLAFSEGGAMSMENKACMDFFGFENIPHPRYIRAMQKKINGGSYIECVEAYYESGLAVLREKKRRSLVSEEEFVKEAKNILKIAISSSKRLFHEGDFFGSHTPFLTHSKDTIYLEQLAIMDKMKASDLENYAFVRGANIKMLGDLAEIGLLDIDKIQKLDFSIIQKIWEKEKGNYLLENPASTDREKMEEIRKKLEALEK